MNDAAAFMITPSDKRFPLYPRRTFLKGMLAGTGLAVSGGAIGVAAALGAEKPDYRGPNVIVIRFGGGARRRESIESATTYSPFLCHELIPRGTLFRNLTVGQIKGLNTSHGEGTLNLVTGHYDQYKDIEGKFLGARFEPKVPTIFEYLRSAFAVPSHQTLLVNGEDRPDEEFYNFSNHFAYGINFRSTMLSLYRFKQHLVQRKIASGKVTDKEMVQLKKSLKKWEKADHRTGGKDDQGPVLEKFWDRWGEYYGESGLVNPRGDRLLTELTLRALKELRPKLIMVNYNDCDYVHWGNMSHYTRAVSIMDEGIKQIFAAVENDEVYRGNTVFVIVPDCGRDTNPFAEVPCQHHFNSKSAHEIFALVLGKGVPAGTVVTRATDQSQVASTIGHFMGFKAEFAEKQILEEAVA